MKGTILTVVVAIAITAGIASAGIASLASGVAVLINATCHSGLHDDIAYSPSRNSAGIRGCPTPIKGNCIKAVSTKALLAIRGEGGG